MCWSRYREVVIMSDEEKYEYGILDDGFTGVFEEEDLSFLDE